MTVSGPGPNGPNGSSGQPSRLPVNRRAEPNEFGDFQTPVSLADSVCSLLARSGLQPASIVEPTCGKGNFLASAVRHFSSARKALGVEINAEYVHIARQQLGELNVEAWAGVAHQDFFHTDWPALLRQLPQPILLVGNPPWVTNSALESIDSGNLPHKSNFKNLAGLDAVTGKSNFDISEWMLIHLLESAAGSVATIAVLCKAAVARKTLLHAWRTNMAIEDARIYLIDAKKHFGAAVDACLFICHIGRPGDKVCQTWPSLTAANPGSFLGYQDGELVANVSTYQRWRHLQRIDLQESPHRWRSGVKHDCAKVMELRKTEGGFTNGIGEERALEATYLYPLLKSSDIATSGTEFRNRWVLITQRRVGEDTAQIAVDAPMTWRYLNEHAALLENRKSALYRGKPPFSIFGVGDYTFSPWKIAISGLYKRLHFSMIGPVEGKPVVFDDTCNLVGCQTEAEAALLLKMLTSRPALEFFESLIFWDAKRPITTEILNKLDLATLASELELSVPWRELALSRRSHGDVSPFSQLAFPF